jgi:hypothetical protein
METTARELAQGLVAHRKRERLICAMCGGAFEAYARAGSRYAEAPAARTCTAKCRYDLWLKRHDGRPRRKAAEGESV